MAAVSETAEDDKELEDYTREDYTEDYTRVSSPVTSIFVAAATINNNNDSAEPQQSLSMDSNLSLLNGARPKLFVFSGNVLSAPCTDDSLPLGALVNGPGSHRVSQEPHVPNKDASPQPGTDTNPEVLQPPSELQSDTSRKPEGHVHKAPPERTPSGSDDCADDKDGDGELPPDALLGDSDAGNGPIGQAWATKSVNEEPLWEVDSESSESSSEGFDYRNGLRERFMCFLLKDGAGRKRTGIEEVPSTGQRRKRKTHRAQRVPTEGESNHNFSCASLADKAPDFDLSINEEPPSLKACMEWQLGTSYDKTVAAEKVLSEEEGDENGEVEPLVGGKTRLETDADCELFPCTKCNVNFKEKRHLHRHMMYHLERHNQVRQECVLRPFICKECGRSFRERSSLHKHTLIHQTRREKLMREIKGASHTRRNDAGRDVRLCCSWPTCAFETDSPKAFVQPTETHQAKQICCCQQCGHMAMNESELEAHRQTCHLNVCQSRFVETMGTYLCNICTFTTKNMNVLRKHFEMIHNQPFYDDNNLDSHNNADDHHLDGANLSQYMQLGQDEEVSSPPSLPSPKLLRENRDSSGTAGPSVWANGISDCYMRDKGAQKSCKGFKSSLIKWSFGSLANNLSVSSLRCDEPSKLSQTVERKDMTTGLPYVEKDNREHESVTSKLKTKYLSSFGEYPLAESPIRGKMVHPNCDSTANGDPRRGGNLVAQAPRHKSPSKRKMSIPYHNAPKNNWPVLPKHEPVSPEWQDPGNLEGGSYYYDDANNANNTSHTICPNITNDVNYCHNTISTFWDNDEVDRHPCRFSFKEDSCDSTTNELDRDEIRTLVVKEESVESVVSEDHSESAECQSESYTSYLVSSVFEMDRKSCPYCPAVFESGVGLSNHVRGHLHRLGLSYEARHMLSREQVASHDRQPRVRRRAPAINRARRDKAECQTEHTCPLCLGWFDTKTGLSNHVRGHLKRIGKPISGVSKSPLCILTELLQDENEHQNIVRALQAKPQLSRPFVSQKFLGSEGLFLTPTGVPVKIQRAARTPNPNRRPADATPLLLFDDEETRKRRREMNGINKMSNSTLVELLKKQREEVAGPLQAVRTRSVVPRTKSSPSPGVCSEEELRSRYSPGEECSKLGNQEKAEVNKKVCIHCNATFHSAVSLSNHLRAYARRKRLALLEGTSYECTQKRPRSRSGPRRKTLSSTHPSSDVIYRLTCRFCDLVFQGPQSVQEDWVKHLQRHLLSASVPGSGMGMMEVTGHCDEPDPPNLHLPLLPQITQGLF